MNIDYITNVCGQHKNVISFGKDVRFFFLSVRLDTLLFILLFVILGSFMLNF